MHELLAEICKNNVSLYCGISLSTHSMTISMLVQGYNYVQVVDKLQVLLCVI